NQPVPGLTNFKYSTYATLVSMTPAAAAGAAMYQQTWQITSQASIVGLRNAQVQVVENIQRMVGVPLFQYAIQSTGNGCGALTVGGGASVTGSVTTIGAPLTVPTPPAPSPVPPTTNEPFTGNCGGGAGCTNLSADNLALAPGTYGNISASGGTSLHLSAGTYNLNSLTLSGGSSLVID